MFDSPYSTDYEIAAKVHYEGFVVMVIVYNNSGCDIEFYIKQYVGRSIIPLYCSNDGWGNTGHAMKAALAWVDNYEG